jgi:hypothetical protein
MKRFPVAGLVFFLVACGSARSTESASPYRVEISADADRIAAGKTVTVTGTIVGAYENPTYYIEVADLAPQASEMEIQLGPDNGIIETNGESAVLELVSATIRRGELTAEFRGKGTGAATVTIGVNGEVGERDPQGKWYFNYISRFSEPRKISVG